MEFVGKTFKEILQPEQPTPTPLPNPDPNLSLLEVMIGMPDADRKKAFATQLVTDVSFKFVSATFNIHRDVVSTRTIGSKKSSYACGPRMCFFPFDTDYRAILDPWVEQVGLLECPAPSAMPSNLPSDPN